MSTIVYVINQNGNPLMPCKPSKARKLLRDGRARVERRSPFTIKLLWDCEEHVQEVVVGIDKGSHVTGFSCVGKGEILLAGSIHHRKDVKEKMDGRGAHRRNRRNRKWYRPKRFNNRSSYTDEPIQIGERVKDFLPPPSQLVKREETVKVTIELTRESIDFFKQLAQQEKVPYQRLLRGIIDAYAKQHLQHPSKYRRKAAHS